MYSAVPLGLAFARARLEAFTREIRGPESLIAHGLQLATIG